MLLNSFMDPIKSDLEKHNSTKKVYYWPKYFPLGVWHEFKHVVLLAIPIMLTGFVEYLIGPVSLMFCGRLGKTELATAGLSISIFHTAGVSIIMGLLTACETLFSQTFGGSNKFRLGVQVQRALVILMFCCLPCWAIHVIIEPILLASGHPPLICRLVGNYLLGMMPGLLFEAMFLVLTKYVQAQSRVIPPLIAGVLGNLVNAAAHYILIFHTDIGVVGSGIAQSFGYMTQFLTLFAYIIISRIYRKTWDSVHVELWHDWGIWFRLGIPGMMMSGMEWWVCESGSLVAGVLGEQALAAQSILNNIESLLYCLGPLGLGVAATIRIGQSLGADREDGPKATSIVAFLSVVTLATSNLFLLSFLRFQLPLIFTNDADVIQLTGDSFPAVIVFQWFDSILGICCGIIRGVGMQKVGAIICCVCMYGIGAPVGLSLMLLTPLGIQGFWIGLCCAGSLESLVYIIICLRIDWKEQCEKAAKRTIIKFVNNENEEIELKSSESTISSELSSEASSEDSEEVKACTFKLVSTRSAFIGFMLLMVFMSLVCRFCIDFSNYFPNHCITGNRTDIHIPNRTERALNATNFDWLLTDCIEIIP